MEDNDKKLNLSCGWGGLITLVLVIAKVMGYVNISWELCLAPFVIGLVATTILAIVAIIGIVIVNRY